MIRVTASVILEPRHKWDKEVMALFELMPPTYQLDLKGTLYVLSYGIKTIHIPTHLTRHYDTWAKAFQEVARDQE
jgi:hypothetical protein